MQIAPFILIRTGDGCVRMCVCVCMGVHGCGCVSALWSGVAEKRSLSFPLSWLRLASRSGGLGAEERLLWVTLSDKLLSCRAILIYVNKPLPLL